MKITIIAIGKRKTDLFDDAIQEYNKRLSRYVEVNYLVLPARDVKSESDDILNKLTNYDRSILLDERGNTWSNQDLVRHLTAWQNAAVKSIVFVIGGAHGVTPELRDRVDEVWSLSDLVFPHELVRVLLAEQLYRSFNTMHGGKYHHN